MMPKLLSLLSLLFISAIITITTTVVTADVVSSGPITVVKGNALGFGGGVVQYYYENGSSGDSVVPSDDTTSRCQAVVILIVGTAMSVGDYVQLATTIVSKSGSSNGSSYVVAIMDNNTKNIKKQSGTQSVNVANQVVENLSTYVPVCVNQQPLYYFGGHSAGGAGAIIAINSSTNEQPALNFPVAGYIGLSPTGFKASNILSIPTLLWDFSLMTCAVCPKTAAQLAYNIVDIQDNVQVPRIFYQVQATNTVNYMLGGDHCTYTDSGCAGMCGGTKTDRSDMHDAVAESIHNFWVAMTNGNYNKQQFILNNNNIEQNTILYTGTDEIVVPPKKRESLSVRHLVSTTCAMAF